MNNLRKFNMGIFVFIVGLELSFSGWAMTVEEAYKAIPHARTVFDNTNSRMNAEEKEILLKFFQLTDRAIVAKVERVQSNWYGLVNKKYDESYEDILREFNNIAVPRKLQSIRDSIANAIKLQQAFLEQWKKSGAGNKQNIAGDKQVQSASAELHQAYYGLMNLYQNESDHNKQAFFDYLCALDFI